jgi:hypothetical protein
MSHATFFLCGGGGGDGRVIITIERIDIDQDRSILSARKAGNLP